MNQLALDLLLASPPRLENFVPGPNAEVLALLDQLGSANALTGPGPGPHPLARQLHLWGPPGSGRSHLL
jgi:chromosomal replication initiation ATPase DnaA